jgi:blue copper oxidase
MTLQKINRRDFLRLAGVNAVALLGSKLKFPALMDEPFMPDSEISITAAEKTVQILSGAQTRVWSYTGQLLSGTGVTVQNLPGNYLGPILRVKSGTKLRIYFHNNLAEDSVIHPHGLRVPEDCDGTPMQAIGPGRPRSTNSR